MDSICAQVADNEIEEALDSVPEDMDATYDRILDMIKKKPQGQRELARRVLICIAYTRSPLPISILSYIVSVKKDTKSLEALESSLPTETTILGACSNLVSIDGNTRYVRFVHFSVQEFLTSDRSRSTFYIGHDFAHRELARMFITLLSILNCQSLNAYKFLGALNNWPFHVLAANLNFLPEDDPLVELVSSFLENGPAIRLRARPLSLSGGGTYLSFSLPVFALIFNLPSRDRDYQPYGKALINDQLNELYVGDRDTFIIFSDEFALHYVVSELDSVSAARRLHAHGYCINYFYNLGPVRISTLHWQYGRNITVCGRMLNQHEIPIGYNRPPLYSAKSEKMVEYLIDNGACMEPHLVHGDPLLVFARQGNTKIIQVFLKRIPDQAEARCGAVLPSAVESPDCGAEVVQLLLSKGADVNAQGGTYGNALQDAALCSTLEVVQLLLDSGAHVNAQGGEYGTAVRAALARSVPSIAVADILLDYGADITIGDTITAKKVYGPAAFDGFIERFETNRRWRMLSLYPDATLFSRMLTLL